MIEPITNRKILDHYLEGTKGIFGDLNPIMYSATPILFDWYDRCKGFTEMVEIGTWRGLSALVFASWGIKVHTFDIIEQEHCKPLWAHFGMDIDQHVCADRAEISGWMDITPFDFAFIDAVHNYENVKADYQMVKRCGNVLFHDYHETDFPGVYKFCNEIGAEPGPYSAFWTAKKA
jgi:hypothetical protein